ncbi:MAG: methyltransferase domain-containing protein [Chitinivibrionales bacterium]|nr:methyltransferase domain-containing protein [Chitinivibrionales bacterium]
MASDMHVCPPAVAGLLNNRVRALVHKPERLLAPYISQGDAVADIGCGPGYFTVAMARMVGPTGRVYAVDLQEKMLEMTGRNAHRRHVPDVVHPVHCSTTELGEWGPVDFALAFWMVHEAPAPRVLLEQIRSHLKPRGRLLVAEPKIHVSEQLFLGMLDDARAIGLREMARPKVRLSWAVLLQAS